MLHINIEPLHISSPLPPWLILLSCLYCSVRFTQKIMKRIHGSSSCLIISETKGPIIQIQHQPVLEGQSIINECMYSHITNEHTHCPHTRSRKPNLDKHLTHFHPRYQPKIHSPTNKWRVPTTYNLQTTNSCPPFIKLLVSQIHNYIYSPLKKQSPTRIKGWKLRNTNVIATKPYCTYVHPELGNLVISWFRLKIKIFNLDFAD